MAPQRITGEPWQGYGRSEISTHCRGFDFPPAAFVWPISDWVGSELAIDGAFVPLWPDYALLGNDPQELHLRPPKPLTANGILKGSDFGISTQTVDDAGSPANCSAAKQIPKGTSSKVKPTVLIASPKNLLY